MTEKKTISVALTKHKINNSSNISTEEPLMNFSFGASSSLKSIKFDSISLRVASPSVTSHESSTLMNSSTVTLKAKSFQQSLQEECSRSNNVLFHWIPSNCSDRGDLQDTTIFTKLSDHGKCEIKKISIVELYLAFKCNEIDMNSLTRGETKHAKVQTDDIDKYSSATSIDSCKQVKIVTKVVIVIPYPLFDIHYF